MNLKQFFSKKKKVLIKNALFEIVIIKFVYLVFGQYYTISSSKIISMFHRLFCVSVNFFIITLLIFDLIKLNTITTTAKRICLIMIAFEYCVWCLVTLLTDQSYISTYILTLSTYDAVLGYKKIIYVSKYAIIYMWTFLIAKLFNSMKSLDTLEELRDRIMLHVFNFSESALHVTCYSSLVVVLSIFLTRLALLRETLGRNTVPVNIVSKDKIKSRLRTIRKCLIYYNNLLDTLDSIDKHTQLLVSASITTCL